MTETPEEVTPGLTEYDDGAGEWEVAFYAYRAAQARAATTAGYLVLNEWNSLVNPASLTSSTAGQFMDYLTRVIRAFRSRQMNLARSYLQYIAALEIQAPNGDPLFGGDSRRLSTYRDTFLDGVRDVAGMGTGEVPLWPTDADWDFILSELRQLDEQGASSNAKSAPLSDLDLSRHLEDLEDSLGPDRDLEGVEFNWPEPEGESNDQGHREYFEDLVKELEDELREDLRREDLIERDESPEDRRAREAKRTEELARVKGNKLAGQVMSATTHAADQVTQWARDTDRRIKMVARGTSATPCAFCAMLASRGFTYASVSSAMTTAGGSGFQRYHPNCQCYPIVRYVDASEAPALNRKFREMWDDAKGRAGSEPTMNVFRRALYEINRDANNARRRRLYHERKAERAVDAAG